MKKKSPIRKAFIPKNPCRKCFHSAGHLNKNEKPGTKLCEYCKSNYNIIRNSFRNED